MANKQGKLAGYINYRMLVTLQDTRQLSGQLLAFDRHMNLVLGDTQEYRQVKRKQNNEQTLQEEKRTLGLIILRGTQVMSLSVESPPPSDPEARLGGKATGIASTLLAGPGVARPTGRGATAPVSLAGPAAGVGSLPGFPGPPGFSGLPAGPPGFRPPLGFPAAPPAGFPGGAVPGFPPGGAPPSGFHPSPRR